MSDKIHSLTVVLEKNISEEQANKIKNALECFQDVICVDANICGSGSYVAETRARNEMVRKLLDCLHNR